MLSLIIFKTNEEGTAFFQVNLTRKPENNSKFQGVDYLIPLFPQEKEDIYYKGTNGN